MFQIKAYIPVGITLLSTIYSAQAFQFRHRQTPKHDILQNDPWRATSETNQEK